MSKWKANNIIELLGKDGGPLCLIKCKIVPFGSSGLSNRVYLNAASMLSCVGSRAGERPGCMEAIPLEGSLLRAGHALKDEGTLGGGGGYEQRLSYVRGHIKIPNTLGEPIASAITLI